MNKFKKVMLGALSVLTLGLFVATGAKVFATAQDYTFKLNLTSHSAATNYSVESGEDSTVKHSIDVQSTYTDNTSKNYTGNSIISTNTGVTYQRGVKMEKASYIQFTTLGSWEIQVLFGCKKANKSLIIADASDGTSNSAKVTVSGSNSSTTATAVVTASSSTAGTYYIRRDGTEEHIFEILLVDNFDNSSSVTVNFYDTIEKTNLIGTRNPEAGGTTTAPDSAVPPAIGMKFDKWLNVSDNSIFSESTTFDADAEFYATFKTDTNYSVTSGNLLDTTTVTKIYDEGFSKQLTSTLPVTNTNFEILNGDTIQADAKTIATGIDDSKYAIKFGGGFNNAKNGLGIMTAGAGKLTIYARANAGDDATSYKGQLFTYDKDATNDKYPMYLETENSADRTAVVKFEFDITDGNYYYFGNSAGAFYVYYAKFEQTSPVVALQQASTGLIDNKYRLVRFIFVVDDEVSLSDLTNKITLIVDGGTENEVTADVSPLAAAKTITSNNSTYVSNGYKFSSKTNISYVVYIAKFTESTFSGHTLKAKLNYGNVDYPTSTYTFA